jgi:O-antigen ligase
MGNWQNVTSEKREAGGLAVKTTAIGRLVLLEASLRMFLDHPFVGVGFHDFGEHSLPYVRQVRTTWLGARESWVGKGVTQHNTFLNMLTEVGLVGFVPQILMYCFIFATLMKTRRVHDGAVDHDFVVVVFAALGAYLACAMFMEPRFFEFMNMFPFLLVGIAVGSHQRATLRIDNNNGRGERRPASAGTIR